MALTMTTEEKSNEIMIRIQNIITPNDKERVRRILAAFNGMLNEYSEYFYDDHDEEISSWIWADVGAMSIIPFGRYKGLTVQDAYEQEGHYSLASLMLTIKKMPFEDKAKLDALYEELIEYSIPRIRGKEISFQDFIAVYKRFIANKTPGTGKTVEDWLALPVEQQEVAYDELIRNMTERMEASIQRR